MKTPEWYAVKVSACQDMTEAFDAGLRFSNRMLRHIIYSEVQENKRWGEKHGGYFRIRIGDERVIRGYSSSFSVYDPDDPGCGWPSILLSYEEFVDLIAGTKGFLADDLDSLI